jgi:hypothetical protein
MPRLPRLHIPDIGSDWTLIKSCRISSGTRRFLIYLVWVLKRRVTLHGVSTSLTDLVDANAVLLLCLALRAAQLVVRVLRVG